MRKALKTFISILCVGVTTAGVVGGTLNSTKANAENNPLEFSSSIRAVTPYEGATLNFNTHEINAWWNSESVDVDYLNGLFKYSDDHKEFATCVNYTDAEHIARVVEIYNENDAFFPENNVLKWTDNLENVSSYTVRIALDNKFTKTVQKVENADKAEGVVLENPLMDTEYFWQVIANLENGGKTYSSIFSFETDASVRTVKIEGVSNTRDIGGFESVYGYVQQGLVYRSARLETITEEGRAAFDKLGIKTDLDLRGPTEASSGPNRYDPLNLGEQYFAFDTPQYSSGTTTVEDGTGINNRNNFESIKNIFSVFADKDNYPIDMHCMVGRDRTGSMSILLKSLLGASEDEAKKDYYASMFATTGAWSKEQTANYQIVVDFIFDYLDTYSGETLADRTATFLIEACGMTQDQIDNIRNIMVGAEGYEVETIQTFADTDNYDGYSFVTFKQYGVKTQTVAVANGETAVAPYVLADGYTWKLNGENFDLETAITQDITLVAKKAEYCSVTINSVDGEKAYTVQAEKGVGFDFTTLNQDGYTAIVMDENGNIVTSFIVEKDCVLNVLYVK